MTNEKKEIITMIKDRQQLIADHSDMTDSYNVGMYNGVELILCGLEKREPVYFDFKSDTIKEVLSHNNFLHEESDK